jgi:hypothetical protein
MRTTCGIRGRWTGRSYGAVMTMATLAEYARPGILRLSLAYQGDNLSSAYFAYSAVNSSCLGLRLCPAVIFRTCQSCFYQNE